MLPPGYPVWVKTIEAIRMANYQRLVAELKGDREKIRGVEIADALGISTGYVSQIKKGRRDAIDSAAARLMERTFQKPVGWMDTDFESWPFPDQDLLAEVEAMTIPQRIELQLAIRQAMDLVRKKKISQPGKSSPSRGSAKRRAPG